MPIHRAPRATPSGGLASPTTKLQSEVSFSSSSSFSFMFVFFQSKSCLNQFKSIDCKRQRLALHIFRWMSHLFRQRNPTNQPTNQQIIATLKYSFLSRTSNWNTTFKVKKKKPTTNKQRQEHQKKTKTKQQSKIVTCFRYHNLCASECEFLPLSLNVLKGWILRNHKTTATTNYKSRKSGHPLKELKQNRNGPLFKRVDNIFVHYHY